jgi:hypothetical protein
VATKVRKMSATAQVLAVAFTALGTKRVDKSRKALKDYAFSFSTHHAQSSSPPPFIWFKSSRPPPSSIQKPKEQSHPAPLSMSALSMSRMLPHISAGARKTSTKMPSTITMPLLPLWFAILSWHGDRLHVGEMYNARNEMQC